MTHDQNHPEHAQENGQPMDIAALLRAAADGELDECQCEQLDAYMVQNPEAAAQVEFEKALKNCCGRAMAKPCCPDALRNKVIALAANAPQSEEAFAQGVEATSAYTKSSSFWSRSPMMGVAAAVLVMVAGTMIWQSASFSNINNAPPGLTLKQANYYNRVSSFVIDEHNRCCSDKAAQVKLIQHDLNEATSYFSQAFGKEMIIPDMGGVDASSIKFFGSGDCSVPSTPRSGHFRFDAVGPDNKRIELSLFVSPDPGLLPMQEGKTYKMNSKACDEAGARLFAWTSNGIQYLLVSEATDELCARVRKIMHAPTEMGDM